MPCTCFPPCDCITAQLDHHVRRGEQNRMARHQTEPENRRDRPFLFSQTQAPDVRSLEMVPARAVRQVEDHTNLLPVEYGSGLGECQ